MNALFAYALRRVLTNGALASAVSGVVLMRRGKAETGSAAAPVNAVSHWLWPRSALRRDAASARYTATGAVVHYAASLLWCGLYEGLRGRRSHPTAANAIGDALAVTAVAAVVDLKLVPKRLTPGFEERLSARSLVMVYGGFAAGLALGGLLALRRD
jgi:hypothetical protein